jgi:hypothetical protein
MIGNVKKIDFMCENSKNYVGHENESSLKNVCVCAIGMCRKIARENNTLEIFIRGGCHQMTLGWCKNMHWVERFTSAVIELTVISINQGTADVFIQTDIYSFNEEW